MPHVDIVADAQFQNAVHRALVENHVIPAIEQDIAVHRAIVQDREAALDAGVHHIAENRKVGRDIPFVDQCDQPTAA